MAKVVSDQLLDALQALDIGNVRENVRRVVIDLQAGHVPVIHVEHIGEDTVIDVFRALDGVEVKRVQRGHIGVSVEPDAAELTAVVDELGRPIRD